MNLLIWFFSIGAQLLPLSTGTYYGGQYPFKGITFCTLVNKPSRHTFFIWVCSVFNGPLLTIVVVTACLVVFVSTRSTNVDTAYARELTSKVIYYPIALLAAWLPEIILVDMFVKENSSTYLTTEGYTRWQVIESWTTLNGLFIAMVFFCNSTESQQRWFSLWKKCWYNNNEGHKSSMITQGSRSTQSTPDFLDDANMLAELRKQRDEKRRISIDSSMSGGDIWGDPYLDTPHLAGGGGGDIRMSEISLGSEGSHQGTSNA
jgi:hypothetical protein